MKGLLVRARWIGRELRGSARLWLLFASSLALGVAAVVAVSALAASLRSGLAQESRRLLAADLKIESRKPFPAELSSALAGRSGVSSSQQIELLTVVRSPATGKSQLVELKAISEGYPFYGTLEIEPAGRPLEVVRKGAALAPRELLARLGIGLGDTLEIGGEPFPVGALLLSEPDRLSTAFTLGPPLLVHLDHLEKTGLTRFGSRVTHRLLVRVEDPAREEALVRELRSLLADPVAYRIETAREGLPEIRQGIARAERFLLLVALVSLALGGIGVAQTVRLWLSIRLDSIAVWKALGARSSELGGLYLGQCLLLALGGSSLGLALGGLLAALLPRWVGGLLAELPRGNLELGPFGLGLGVGLGIALAFAWMPLRSALSVPAVRVLRREVEPLPLRRGEQALALALVAGSVWLSAWLLTRSLVAAWSFTGALGGILFLLGGVVRLVLGLAHRMPRSRFPLSFRYGWAALGRPGSVSRGALVALGVGSFVLVSVEGVRRGVVERLSQELPRDAPTAFLIDIQPYQWPGVRGILEEEGATGTQSVPVVMARLSSIDGQPILEVLNKRKAGERRERWALTREQRLTYLDTLPSDNRLVAGSLWSHPDQAEVSVEAEFANDLGIGIGSRLGFDVQGVPIELLVTSLRKVDWQSFQINFFLVVEPGVLEEAPQMRLAASRLPRGRESEIQDRIVAAFPNVTVFPIREVLDKVVAVLGRITAGIRFLGAFTVGAGLAILAGALGTAGALRAREVALLKTLGLRRTGVVSWFAIEYALAGALAGAVGGFAGAVAQRVVLERAFTISAGWSGDLLLAAALGLAALAAVTGLLASLPALSQRPADVFRA